MDDIMMAMMADLIGCVVVVEEMDVKHEMRALRRRQPDGAREHRQHRGRVRGLFGTSMDDVAVLVEIFHSRTVSSEYQDNSWPKKTRGTAYRRLGVFSLRSSVFKVAP